MSCAGRKGVRWRWESPRIPSWSRLAPVSSPSSHPGRASWSPGPDRASFWAASRPTRCWQGASRAGSKLKRAQRQGGDRNTSPLCAATGPFRRAVPARVPGLFCLRPAGRSQGLGTCSAALCLLQAAAPSPSLSAASGGLGPGSWAAREGQVGRHLCKGNLGPEPQAAPPGRAIFRGSPSGPVPPLKAGH